MIDGPIHICETMSPAAIAPLIKDPEVCAVARDRDLYLIWCNEAYANVLGSTPEELEGTLLEEVMTPEQAEERNELMRDVLETGRLHAHQEMRAGKRWLTRVWPLDPDSFGREGYFILITRLTDELPIEEGDVEFVRTPDLGPLSVLSPRELEIFYYLATGMSTADVAQTLFRSVKTIGNHIDRIYKKMGYTSRSQLISDAVGRGLIHFTREQWTQMVDPSESP